MAFSPWNGLEAHRPLGSVNRTRREAYAEGAAFRARHIGCPIHHPATKLSLPGAPSETFGRIPGREGRRPNTPDALLGAVTNPMRPTARILVAAVPISLGAALIAAARRPGARVAAPALRFAALFTLASLAIRGRPGACRPPEHGPDPATAAFPVWQRRGTCYRVGPQAGPDPSPTMLSAFRRLAGTWFARGLFILLILSFAIWGIEDVVRNFGRDTAVARVGGARIELTEAQTAARRETQRLLRQLGPTFEANEGFRQAVARQAVESLVADRAQGAEARRQGVATSAEAVRAYTFAIPTFQGVDGRFSPAILQQFLRQNDMNEADFVRLVASDLRRQQLVGAVRAGSRGPGTLTRPLLAFTLEQRAADVVELPLLSAPDIPEPADAQLRRFHENNPERFSSPEYREVTVALLNAETLAQRVNVTDAEVEAGLDAARARVAGGEKRTLEQVLVNDRAAADAIRAAWAGGADLPAIRQQAEAAGGAFLELGTVDRDGLPLPALAEAAFGAPSGGITDPVQSPFGWHVVRVVAVEAAPRKSDAELREEVRADLAREKAADRAYEEANRLEDAFAGGSTVEEAATRLGLTPAKVRLDRQGNDESGRPVPLPGGAAVRAATLTAIFAPAPPRGGRLAEVPGGYMALEVTSTAPAQLKPFETVEADVRRWWLIDQQRRAQEGRAAALLSAAQGGKDFAEAAREAGLGDPVRMGPSPRVAPERGPQPPNAIPRELLPGLFTARVGEVTMAETSFGFAVARLAEIVPADLDGDPAALTRVKAEVEQAMQDDLEAQYAAALRARADVTINQSLMEQVATR